MRYVTITLDEFRKAFSKTSANGRQWRESVVRNEIVFDLELSPNTVVRVYSSFRNDSGTQRKKGVDPIRVCAFDPINDKGLVRAPHVKRVAGWHQNLRERIHYVVNQLNRRRK